MSKNNNSSITSSIGLIEILQIVFIILKLCNVITWKWVFVLMPLIVQCGIVALVLLVPGVYLIASALKSKRGKKRW